MFFLRLQILPIFCFIFILLHTSVSTFSGQFDNVTTDISGSSRPAIFSSKPPIAFLLFGRVEATVNAVIILIIILDIVVYKLRQIREEKSGEKLYNLSPLLPEKLCRRFSLDEILSATNNFDESLVIGKGGFGITYLGIISNGTCKVAIKRLKLMSKQGAPEFWTEVKMLSKVRHCHVISLIGFCDSNNEMILVYEYMSNGTLANHLHKRANGDNHIMPWSRRLKICMETARGIDYLHTGTCDGVQHVIHRDVKSSNILLDDNWTAKISDFGISTIGPTQTPGNNGTRGYRDPSRKLSCKSDVYAFGVVLFEVFSGRRAVDIDFYIDECLLAKWAQRCIREGKVDEIIDVNLRGEISQHYLSVFVQIANRCLDEEPENRPTMAEVVIWLKDPLLFQNKFDFNSSGLYENSDHEDSHIVEGHNFYSSVTYVNQERDVTAWTSSSSNSC